MTTLLGFLPALCVAAEPAKLDEANYKSHLGILMIEVNWGRVWKCGTYENAQLQSLAFKRSSGDTAAPVAFELETPSKLFVDNRYVPYAFVVQPGEYWLTGFDVKVARSRSDVGHLKGSPDALIREGKPIGGQFTINAGEVVYVGHFGLDCGAEPFLWRQYIDDRREFGRYVGVFRSTYPFIKQVPVHYRLFSTQLFGKSFSLNDPIFE